MPVIKVFGDLRSHAVMYVCVGVYVRDQVELRFGKWDHTCFPRFNSLTVG